MLQSNHSSWSRYGITVYKASSNEDDNDDEDDDDDDNNDDVYRKNIVNENEFMPLGEFQLWINFVLRDDKKTTTLHPNAYTVIHVYVELVHVRHNRGHNKHISDLSQLHWNRIQLFLKIMCYIFIIRQK